jgi:hypothetical protein
MKQQAMPTALAVMRAFAAERVPSFCYERKHLTHFSSLLCFELIDNGTGSGLT